MNLTTASIRPFPRWTLTLGVASLVACLAILLVVPLITTGSSPLGSPSLILPLVIGVGFATAGVIGVGFATAGSALIGYSMDRTDSDTTPAVKAMIRARNSDTPRDHLAYRQAMRRRRIGIYGSLAAAAVCYAIAATLPLLLIT